MSGLVLIASLSSVLPFSLLEARCFDNLYPHVFQNAKFVQLRWYVNDVRILKMHQQDLVESIKLLQSFQKRADLKDLIPIQEKSIERQKLLIEITEKRMAGFKRVLDEKATKEDD